MLATGYKYQFALRTHRHWAIDKKMTRAVIGVPKAGQTTYVRRIAVGRAGMFRGEYVRQAVETGILNKKPHRWPEFYAFVRNPWDHMVSGFFYGIKKGWFKPGSDFKAFIRGGVWKELPFAQWVHFQQHSEFTHEGCFQVVDHIYRFEKFESEAKRFARALGVDDKNIPVMNKTEHLPYREYYDDETRAIVASAFADDISNFGYQF